MQDYDQQYQMRLRHELSHFLCARKHNYNVMNGMYRELLYNTHYKMN